MFVSDLKSKAALVLSAASVASDSTGGVIYRANTDRHVKGPDRLHTAVKRAFTGCHV